MRRTVLRLVMIGSVLFLVAFIVVVANQTAQLVALASHVSPLLGTVLLWTLLALYVFCIAAPVYLILRLPRRLEAPQSIDDAAYPAYVERLAERVRRNELLAGAAPETLQNLEASLLVLDRLAEDRIKRVASQVFVSTAVSQNGSLDAVLVLTAQCKMVLDVARIYFQRPTLRDMVFLYSNVAATAFVAGELEDIDVSQQLEPITGALLGSTMGAIPGLGPATTVMTNSVLSGTGNAYLTLRVGLIVQQYCRSPIVAPRRSLRRTAAARAATMLGGIALAGSKRVMAGLGDASKGRVVAIADAAGGGVRAAGASARDMAAAAASSTTEGLRAAADATTAAAARSVERIRNLSSAAVEKLRIKSKQPDGPAGPITEP
jgi:hypothetical protein